MLGWVAALAGGGSTSGCSIVAKKLSCFSPLGAASNHSATKPSIADMVCHSTAGGGRSRNNAPRDRDYDIR